MSWYANTLYPAIEGTFGHDDAAAPQDAITAAKILEVEGHESVAKFVAALPHDEYERLLFDAKVNSINAEYGDSYDYDLARR